ncbi:MAG TPA: hypothetical protein VMA34_07775 [Terracidiphilus sp.]|nr:hypothetical protein [Terracidiphilus sp.]
MDPSIGKTGKTIKMLIKKRAANPRTCQVREADASLRNDREREFHPCAALQL